MLEKVLSLVLGVVASIIASLVLEKYGAKELLGTILGVDARVILAIIFVSIFSFLFYLLIPFIKPYFNLVKTAKYRGLLTNGRLNKLVSKYYSKSKVIKIKVTRGYNLFALEDGIYFKEFFDKQYNKEKKVKILLHYPCIQSGHLKNRSEANQKPIEEYIKDMFIVLKHFKEHTLSEYTDEKIEVRFYQEKHADWRYYIFENYDRKKTLLFNHYSKKTKGSKSNMINVAGGDDSLCDYIDQQFDHIFKYEACPLVSNTIGCDNLMNTEKCTHSGCKTLIENIYSEVFT